MCSSDLSAWQRGADALYLFNWMDSDTRPVDLAEYVQLLREGLSREAVAAGRMQDVPREAWVVAMAACAAVLALLPVALEFFGSDWKVAARSGAKGARTKEGVLSSR